MNSHLRVVPSPRVQPSSRLSLGAMLALLAIGALSGVVTGWLLSVFFRG